MKDKQNKQKGFDANAQRRPVIIIGGTVGVVVVAILASYLFSSLNLFGEEAASTAAVGGTPSIESLPGIGDPSAEYSRLIADQNKALAEQALKEGGSALPTVVKPQYSLNTDAFEQEYNEKQSVSRDADRCSRENLIQARNAGVAAGELKCYGCTLEDLKNAGFTAAELKAAGFSAAEMKAAGFTALELKEAGYDACELSEAGYPLAELVDAGYSVKRLLDCGFTPSQLLAANVSIAELKAAGADVSELLADGVSAADLIANGYCADGVLKAVPDPKKVRTDGVDAGDLFESGVSVPALLDMGYSTREILEAGASVSLMLANGVDASDLRSAGVSKKEVSFAQKNLSQVKGGVCTVQYATGQLNAGVQASVLLPLGCSPTILKEVGYPARDLVREGVSVGRLRAAGYSASNLVAAGVTLDALVKGCYSVESLLEAGFTPAQLLKAGVSVSDLLKSGVSVSDLGASGANCGDLYRGGASVADLFAMGCSAEELRNAGASASELLSAGYSISDLRAAGFSAGELLAAGATVSDLLAAGYSINELKSAGVTDGQLIRAGVSTEKLYGKSSDQGIGCSTERINAAFASGSSVKDLLDKGCSVESLVRAGVSVAELLAAGASVEDLLKAGITVSELLDAGVTVSELLAAGVDVSDLMAAGVSIEELIRAGASAEALLAAGVRIDELLNNGMLIEEILKAKPDAQSLYLAGINVSDLVGYSSDELQKAGYQNDMMLLENEESDIDRIARLQDEALSRQDRERRVLQLSGAMQAQASALFASWDNQPRQSINVSTNKPGDYIKTQPVGVGANGVGLPPVVKAGTMMYAVLDNAVNTEDPAPVTATIVSGPLKGASILGEFKQEGEKLVLKFEKINIPSKRTSTDISLFAVDVNTARNVSIDSHYLLRYGSLAAASFLEGLNEVAGTLGVSVSTDGNTTTVKEGGLSKSKVVAAGLGKIGENLVTETQKFQNKAPTIRMKVGATFGTLVMEDFTILDL